MKNFRSYKEFALYTIEENLKMANICLSTSKDINKACCYGMSALVLLGSAIDIIGTLYHNGFNIKSGDVESNNLGQGRDHFSAFYNKFCTSECTKDQFMRSVYELARCRATHNGVLGQRVKITINPSPSGKFINIKHRNGKDYTAIHMNELLLWVENSYNHMRAETNTKISTENFAPTTGICADLKYIKKI